MESFAFQVETVLTEVAEDQLWSETRASSLSGTSIHGEKSARKVLDMIFLFQCLCICVFSYFCNFVFLINSGGRLAPLYLSCSTIQ